MTNRGSQFAYRSRFLLFGWTWVVLVAGPASLGIAIFSASAWGDRAGTLYFYGWPLRFMTYRDYYTDPFDQALMAAPIEGGLGGVFPTPTWTEQEDEVLEFSTFALVFDVVLAVAFIVSAAFFVEGSCRRNFLPLRFGLVSFFALFGFVGTWLALSRIMSGAGGDEYWKWSGSSL